MFHKSAFVLFSAAIVIGCSSSSASGTTSGDGGGGGAGGGSLTGICPKAQTDIAALLASAPTINEIDAISTDTNCNANGLQIEVRSDDTDKSLYLTAYGDGGGDTQAITGVGDTAYFWGVNCGTGTCQSIPTVAVHKGDATCYISNDNTPSNYSMPFTQDPPPFGIKESDAVVWAGKAGKVCTDLFSAAGL
jgi:hypothetical protein